MKDIETKKNLIIHYETQQAQRLACKVIFKPPLTVWYILIPVIFVYYFFRLNKYSSSRKAFVEHFMRSRKRAIEAATISVVRDRPPGIDDMIAQTRIPSEAVAAFKSYAKVLVEHYADLLNASGGDHDTLLKAAYRTRSNYLLFLNRLGQVEKALDQALAPSLATDQPTVGDTIALIERQIAQLRRDEADRIFG